MQATKQNGEIKHFVNCEGIDEFNMKSTLVVYNVAPRDVGNYVCIANNGIGREAMSTMALYSTCEHSFNDEIILLLYML